MKKLIIGALIGAAAIGATIAPATAGGFGGVVGAAPTNSIWETLVLNLGNTEHASDADGTDIGLSDLVLIAGLGSALDTCGNGKAQYTLLAPVNEAITELLGEDGLDATIADLAAAPNVVRAILNDHLVNGSFSPEQLALSKRLVTRSGYVINVQNINTLYTPDVSVDDYYANGNQIIMANAACNGWVYTILGVINSRDYVVSEGMNTLDAPKDGTAGGTDSLPNTL